MLPTVALAALIACAAIPVPVSQPDTITVSAAVSLTEALEAVGRAYTAATRDIVRFNFAGSNVLARQIISGAPVDVFISADEEQMALAERAGAIDASTQVALLGNRLVVVTPEGGHPIKSIADLSAERVRRIAIGDPAAVPAGVYARRYLESLGAWAAIEKKCVPVANVRAALAAVVNASVDAAFVYETDLRMAHEQEVALAFVVSGGHAPRIVYPAAVSARSAHRAAALRFLTWLKGPAATRIFEAAGFQPLARAAR